MNLPEADLIRLRRRGVWLQRTSVAWTVTVAAVAIAAGIAASSIALIGLGLESAIEVLAAAIVLWQLSGGGDDAENRAVGLIAITFLGVLRTCSARAFMNWRATTNHGTLRAAWP
jgi:hypothetical protein